MLPILLAMASAGAGLIWTLSGGSRTYNTTQPDVANVIWIICGNATGTNNTQKGYIQQDGYDSGDAVSYTNEHAFVSPLSGWSVIYVRLTATAGAPDSSSHAVDGSTWHTLTEDSTNITWTETHDSEPAESCTVQVEFSTESDGSNIVATGSYTSQVSAGV